MTGAPPRSAPSGERSGDRSGGESGERLSPLAERLLAGIGDPSLPGLEADFRRLGHLGDEELGALLPAVYLTGDYPLRSLFEQVIAERQVRFSPPACARMFDVLERDPRSFGFLELGAGALLRCTGPWPDGLARPAETLVRHWLGSDEARQGIPFALLTVAALAGPRRYRKVARLAAGQGPLARAELDLLKGWDVTGHALLAETVQTRWAHRWAPLPDGWRRLADHGYAAFGRSVLEQARDRVEAIQDGRIPYEADKAFTAGEVATLGRAARVALMADEPWLPELLDRLLRGVAVAPTAARTLPSQALLYELARAGQDFPTPELATSLRTVRTIARHAAVPKQLDKMLKKIEAALADRADVALRLPGLGFGADGVLLTPLGEHEAVVTAGEKVELSWRGPGSRPLRSVPAAVRRDHAAEVKDLRALVKRAGAHLTTLARALESGFPGEHAMPYGEWRARLGAHPLAGTMARRLIWEVETAPGEWRAGLPTAPDAPFALLDAAGEALPVPGEDAPIRLWHPIRATPAEVRAWRDVMTGRHIRQPFKQAFREIYLLTPAERETGVYSNRFAAHILHYRRLFALFRARGWKSRMLGPWDGGGEDTAYRTFASGTWRAAFHHEYVPALDERELATTDQVRLARREDGGWRDAPLAEAPAVVFSEAMRDVDLFVGVTSIAADPDWQDRGEDLHLAYWRDTTFGELTASAEVRRDALARILPRTRIAERCSLEGRYLVVRGDLRTYRIHLGSANILMEPDDSYLCIVSARGKGPGTVFLPFEDERLALILSKAFLLAADTAITDETILRQIERGA